jgi:uncharacterized protein (TIGR02646 family)
MRSISKLPPPDALVKNTVKWTKEYIRAKKNNSLTETISTRYRDPEIKKQLLIESRNKCAYCESYFRAVAPGDIEHIIPKSRDEKRIFCWHNLTISCPECNRRKGIYFDPSCPLLNPYSDPVEDLLVHFGPFVYS